MMQKRTPKVPLEEDISAHIFNVSAVMMGVCLTVIGLIGLVMSIRQISTLADELLAIAAMLFLISCLCSYGALRTRSTRRMHRLERIADSIFVIALVFMVIICVFLSYTISYSG